MAVLRDGTFDFTIQSNDLAKGLRPSKRNPRDSKYLVECVGAVGIDKVLQVIDDLENDRIDTSVEISDGFPYPQIFVFVDHILICDSQNIYSWDGTTLTLEVGPVAAGELWSAVDFFNFIYMTNNSVVVTRDVETGVFATTTDHPAAKAMCNFNGQVILGSPTEL